MKNLITLVLAFVLHYSVQGQVVKGQVKGRDGSTLVNSTVMFLDTKDSTMLSFAKTKENGLFEIKKPAKEEAILQVSYVGYEKFMLYLNLSTLADDLGVITLDSASKELAELVIKGEKAAVEIKKDTVEFNASSFKVQENAMAEDLLKRMPGMEVDRDGSVTAQGKSVTRVLVEGKEFFGRDPKMATKNIPADAIDKVQLFDKKSDRAEFTGIDDGEEETTINLVLKENKKNLGFGRVNAGLGADANKDLRYNVGGTYSSFKNGNQLSFVGNANNVNQMSFSNNEFSMIGVGRGGGGISFGGGGMAGSARSGLMRNISGGVNFNNKLSQKAELNGSYNYTNSNTYVTRDGSSQSVIGNLETSGNSSSIQDSDSQMHRLNFTLNSKLNDKNSIRWTNRLDFRDNSNLTESEDAEYIRATEQLRNSTSRVNTTEGNSIGFTSQALYQLAFAKKGRTLTTNLTFGLNNSNNDGRLLSNNGLFDAATGTIQYTLLNQINTQKSDRTSMGAEFSYTEPLNTRNFVEVNYSFQKVANDLDKEVFNVKETGNTLDSTLSNKYNNDYFYNRAGLSYRMSYEKWNANFGAAIQDSRLEGNLILRNELIKKRFTNPVFTGRLRYSFTSAKSMDLSYNTSVSEPSITQLSPVPDNSNPLNIYVGNPDLKPQYAQRMNVNYRSFNQLNFTSFFVAMGLNYTSDNITDSVTVNNETLARIRKPINYGDNLSFNGVANYGFRIRPISTRFSITSSFNVGRSQTLINNLDNITNTFMNTNSVRADITPGDNLILGLSARVSFNNTTYSQNSQLNPNYVNQGYTGDLEWKLGNLFTLNSTMDYSIYKYATSDEVQRVPLWNAAIFKSILKGKKAEIRFSVNDILGRNRTISQSASGNTFSETRTNALGRYFLFTFTYNINGGVPSMGRPMGR
ncbi:outer membrane beta-barrel protein [Leadbetterella byssophila]|uniref:outer membrane beta-barrel protein n=1 Tax=Leadbetterella byssophila TaxID=316068 RepID=UPI00399FBC7A